MQTSVRFYAEKGDWSVTWCERKGINTPVRTLKRSEDGPISRFQANLFWTAEQIVGNICRHSFLFHGVLTIRGGQEAGSGIYMRAGSGSRNKENDSLPFISGYYSTLGDSDLPCLPPLPHHWKSWIRKCCVTAMRSITQAQALEVKNSAKLGEEK